MTIDNLVVAAGRVAAPTFSSPGGNFAAPVVVTISSATPGATIRYTTDGTMPTPTTGTAIASGSTVTVSQNTPLNAVAFETGYVPSSVTGAQFSIRL